MPGLLRRLPEPLEEIVERALHAFAASAGDASRRLSAGLCLLDAAHAFIGRLIAPDLAELLDLVDALLQILGRPALDAAKIGHLQARAPLWAVDYSISDTT